jgi:hypothetical protein
MRAGRLDDPAAATKPALRSLARRWQALLAEIDELDALLTTLVTAAAPRLIALPGVGVDNAGQLLVTAGDNPQRLRRRVRPAQAAGRTPARDLPAAQRVAAEIFALGAHEFSAWNDDALISVSEITSSLLSSHLGPVVGVTPLQPQLPPAPLGGDRALAAFGVVPPTAPNVHRPALLLRVISARNRVARI